MNAKEIAKAFWEAIKTPLRTLVLVAVSFVLNLLLVLASEAVKKYTGFDIPEDYKAQFMGYGTAITTAIMLFLDNFMHNIGKLITTKTGEQSKLVTGITRF